MNHNKNCIKTIENSIGFDNVHEQRLFQLQIGFFYQQKIVKLMFTAVKCQPDILHAVIKLRQYSNLPASVHDFAVE